MLSPIKGQVAVNVFFPTGLKNDDVMVMVKSENCMLNHDYLTTPGLYLSTYLNILEIFMTVKMYFKNVFKGLADFILVVLNLKKENKFRMVIKLKISQAIFKIF